MTVPMITGIILSIPLQIVQRHVGSTREEVEAAYGVSDNDQYGSSEGGYFAFLYDGDVVSLIMYCLD